MRTRLDPLSFLVVSLACGPLVMRSDLDALASFGLLSPPFPLADFFAVFDLALAHFDAVFLVLLGFVVCPAVKPAAYTMFSGCRPWAAARHP